MNAFSPIFETWDNLFTRDAFSEATEYFDLCSLHTQVVTNWASTSTISVEERGLVQRVK